MRLSSAILASTTLALSVFFVTGSAQAQQTLSAAETYALNGIYEEQTTCFAFAMLAGAAAKDEGKSAEVQEYIELGAKFDKGKNFFASKIGKTSDDISQDSTDAVMRIHKETGDNLKKIAIAKEIHRERCDAMLADLKPFLAEYLNKYSNER